MVRAVKRIWHWLCFVVAHGLFWKASGLASSPVGLAARRAVEHIAKDRKLQDAAGIEATTSYCPRCGQLPSGDRRMEEARELAITDLGYSPKRSDLDFALAVHYYRMKTQRERIASRAKDGPNR